MLQACRKLALEGGGAPPLVVIGRGKSFGDAAGPQAVHAQQAVPDRGTDFTTPVSSRSIEAARSRPVYWQPIGTLEEVLANEDPDFLPRLCSAITHGLDLQ